MSQSDFANENDHDYGDILAHAGAIVEAVDEQHEIERQACLLAEEWLGDNEHSARITELEDELYLQLGGSTLHEFIMELVDSLGCQAVGMAVDGFRAGVAYANQSKGGDER